MFNFYQKHFKKLHKQNVGTNGRRKNKNAGFTLIEILIVLAIIGILITIVAPSGKVKDTAALQSLAAKVQTIYQAAQMCTTRKGDMNYKNCKTKENLKPYLPASAQEASNDFYETPWSETITITTQNGDASFQIDIPLSQSPDGTTYCDELVGMLEEKATEASCGSSTATILY